MSHRGRSLQGAWDATDLMVPGPRGVVAAITPFNCSERKQQCQSRHFRSMSNTSRMVIASISWKIATGMARGKLTSHRFVVLRWPMAENDRTQTERQTTGVVKVQVVVALPDRQEVAEVVLPEGATAMQAVAARVV